MATGSTVTWSAPGRVNLIGEHLDYNGGPVLPFALDLRTTVVLSPRAGDGLEVTSEGLGRTTLTRSPQPGDVSTWARYVAGAVWAFVDATGGTLPELSLAVSSTVPIGAGLASSAAVECAVVGALDAYRGTGLSRREIAAVALHAERQYVGVPCGPMDQLAVMLSTTDAALLIDTRTLDAESVPLSLTAAGLTLLVINTRVSHALADGAYADRQDACTRAAAALRVDFLCDADLDAVLSLRDPVLRRRAHHVVTETQRVRDVVALLRRGRACDIGALLTASHQSLAENYEVSSPELDAAVDAALAAGALGARMTGGGFGGCAIALCRAAEAAGIAASVLAAFRDAGFAVPDLWPATPAAGAGRARASARRTSATR